jgi:hypothetical protein
MAEKACARFVLDRSLVRADRTVRWKAFLDKRPPHETSVNSHESMGVGIHWDEGNLVNPSRTLLGAADLLLDSIVSLGLGIRLAPVPGMPHHAEIFGWPQGDDEDVKLKRIDLATDLATVSTYFERCAPALAAND